MTDREKMMRNIGMFLALGMTLTGLPAGWAQDDPPAEVTVPDAALRAVLEDSLGLSAGAPIPAAELAKLAVLETPNLGIVGEALAGLTNLTPLYLAFNPLTREDGEVLSGLTGLTVHGIPGPPLRYPRLGSRLSQLAEEYEAALAAGRVTSSVVPGLCDYEFYVDHFQTWDPSRPLPSLHLNILTDTQESADAVARWLGDHGISRKEPRPVRVNVSAKPLSKGTRRR